MAASAFFTRIRRSLKAGNIEQGRSDYPKPDHLWRRYCEGPGLTNPRIATQLLEPFNQTLGKGERYYQQTAINRAVEAILSGRRRFLLTMATGTGKTPSPSRSARPRTRSHAATRPWRPSTIASAAGRGTRWP
jgi:hypothetical protein